MRLLPVLAMMLAARGAWAASPLELERELTKAAARRDSRLAERQRLQAQALAAAERVASLKAPDAASGRAGGKLARQLRDFDSLAAGLENLERELSGLDRRMAGLRAEFDAAADVEERRLEERVRREGAASVAASLDALRDARRRVSALAEAPGFRPPLEIGLTPMDGPAELEAKLALIEGEGARIAERLAECRREEVLLATRVDAKREWVRHLAAARRDAAGSVSLLDRGYENAQAALLELSARRDALARERAALDDAWRRLQARRTEAEGRLTELRKGR